MNGQRIFYSVILSSALVLSLAIGILGVSTHLGGPSEALPEGAEEIVRADFRRHGATASDREESRWDSRVAESRTPRIRARRVTRDEDVVPQEIDETTEDDVPESTAVRRAPRGVDDFDEAEASDPLRALSRKELLGRIEELQGS